MSKKPLTDENGEVRELWPEDFKDAKRMKDIMPDVVEALKRGPGRPKLERPKVHIGLRLDADVVDWLRSHDGYNRLANEIIGKAMEEDVR